MHAASPAVVYTYSSGRGAVHAPKLLDDYSSIVQGLYRTARMPCSQFATREPRLGLASVIETALNGADPEAYLTDVLEKLVNGWPA